MRPLVPLRLRLIAALCAAALAAGCGASASPQRGSTASSSVRGAASTELPAAQASSPGGEPADAAAGLDIHAAAFLPGGTGLLGAWSGPGCYGGAGGCAWRVLRVAPAGAAWVMAAPVAGFLTGLSFPQTGLGWALGGSCDPESPAAGCVSAVLATTDGGADWTTVYSRPDALFLKVDFVSAQDGWLALRSGALLRSGDGGRSWTPVAAPCAGLSGLDQLASFSFLDARSGLAVCQAPAPAASVRKEVLRTADGGRSWSPLHASLPASGGAIDLAVSSPTSAWLCTWPVGGPLLVSRDGGRTWTRAGRALGGANVVGLSAPLGDPSAIDAVIGLGPSAAVVGSADDGHSWTPVFPRSGPFLGAGGGPAVEFTGPDAGYGMGVPADPSAVFATSDAGRSWAVVGRLPADAALIGWSFIPGGAGWAIAVPKGGSPLLLATPDAGGRWTPVAAAPAEPRLAVRTAAGGVVVAGDTLYRSEDGGAHFVPVGPATGIVALALPPGGPVWAIAGGTLRRSSDGGRSWQSVAALPANQQAVALSFADAQHGYVLADSACVGEGACAQTLWSTTDGGRTWSSLPLAPSGVATIDFPAAGDGWLTTQAGALYHSTDGGRSWTPVD